MESLLKLTKVDGTPVLIGVESIIDADAYILKPYDKPHISCTKIESRGGMVTTNYVLESVDTIYSMYKQQTL